MLAPTIKFYFKYTYFYLFYTNLYGIINYIFNDVIIYEMPTKQTLVVTKDDITISVPNTVQIIYGDISDITSKFNALATAKTTGATVQGLFNFTVNKLNLATLSTSFDVGSYDVVISFVPTNITNYNESSITMQNYYIVAMSNVTINLILQYSTIVYGTMCTSNMFTSTAVDEKGNTVDGTFSYTINGTPFQDQILDAGSYEIDVLFTPSLSANYIVKNNSNGNGNSNSENGNSNSGNGNGNSGNGNNGNRNNGNGNSNGNGNNGNENSGNGNKNK